MGRTDGLTWVAYSQSDTLGSDMMLVDGLSSRRWTERVGASQNAWRKFSPETKKTTLRRSFCFAAYKRTKCN